LADALKEYRTALEIGEGLATRDRSNGEWQHGLAISHNNIGDLLELQADRPGALAEYRKALGIAELLAARDPTNANWQRGLTLSHNYIGNVLNAHGDTAGAAVVYRKDLGIIEALAARDPLKAEWQRDLVVTNYKLGGVTGDKAYIQKALDIAIDMRKRGMQIGSGVIDQLRSALQQ
jgi:tetratricopeptide (TPR) repeat protein